MSTDRELLELAAKAAGIELRRWSDLAPKGGQLIFGALTADGIGEETWWNPLADDGDALRLAVKLGMGVSIHPGHCMACGQHGTICTEKGDDTAVAARLAIVRAAAEIGRSMS